MKSGDVQKNSAGARRPRRSIAVRLEDQPEAQLDEPLEVRLTRDVAVDRAEVCRCSSVGVVPLGVNRAVEQVERLETPLEPDFLGDWGRLREVHVHLPERRSAE